jgi:hypothetical protein
VTIAANLGAQSFVSNPSAVLAALIAAGDLPGGYSIANDGTVYTVIGGAVVLGPVGPVEVGVGVGAPGGPI